MLPNQYYQTPINNYQMPAYQNYQAQQRQEQLNQAFSNVYNCIFVRDRSEAENYQIAPGNHLIFEDQNGIFFYTKSLGFAPNDRPVFSVFKREDQTRSQEPIKEEPNKYEEEMNSLRQELLELKDSFKEFTTRPTYNKFDKKGGGK